MDFDIISFLVGFIIAGALGWSLHWSETHSLANRIAFYLCERAVNLVALKKIHLQASHLDREWPEMKDEELYPIEDDEFLIENIPSLYIQSDVHIASYAGVYSKQHNLHFLIEQIFNLEKLESKRWYYFSDTEFNFDREKIIKTPFILDVERYLK